jgi:hypothetical protein
MLSTALGHKVTWSARVLHLVRQSTAHGEAYYSIWLGLPEHEIRFSTATTSSVARG